MLLRGMIALTALAVINPTSASAQWRRNCEPCGQRAIAPPPPATTYIPQNFVTCQPVTTTQVRRQAVQVNVPVTTHRQVTIDEGSYQTVWVPKLVTKTVAETRYQPQLSYVDVPYQVVQNVPVMQSQLVSLPAYAYSPPPYYGGYAVANSVPQISATTVAPALSPQPRLAEKPDEHLVPDPQQMRTAQQDQDWVKVPTKSRTQVASEVELQSFENVNPTSIRSGLFERPSVRMGVIETGRYVR